MYSKSFYVHLTKHFNLNRFISTFSAAYSRCINDHVFILKSKKYTTAQFTVFLIIPTR